MIAQVGPGECIAVEVIVDNDPMLVDELPDDGIGDEARAAGYEVGFQCAALYPQSFTRLG